MDREYLKAPQALTIKWAQSQSSFWVAPVWQAYVQPLIVFRLPYCCFLLSDLTGTTGRDYKGLHPS